MKHGILPLKTCLNLELPTVAGHLGSNPPTTIIAYSFLAMSSCTLKVPFLQFEENRFKK